MCPPKIHSSSDPVTCDGHLTGLAKKFVWVFPSDGTEKSEQTFWPVQCIPKKQILIHLEYFRGGSVVKNPPTSAGDAGDKGLISALGRSGREGNGNPL